MNTVKTVSIDGAGTMGVSITMVCTRAGFRTHVFDTRQEALDRVRRQTDGFLRKSVQRGNLTQKAR